MLRSDPAAHPCMKMASVQKSSNQLQSDTGQQSRRFRRKMKCSTNSLNFCGPRVVLGRLWGEEGGPRSTAAQAGYSACKTHAYSTTACPNHAVRWDASGVFSDHLPESVYYTYTDLAPKKDDGRQYVRQCSG